MPADGHPQHLFEVPHMPGSVIGSYFSPTSTPPPYHHGFIPHPPGTFHPVPGSFIPFDHDPSMIPQIWTVEVVNGIPTYVPCVHFNAGAVPPPHDPYWQISSSVGPCFSPGMPLIPYFPPPPPLPGEHQQVPQSPFPTRDGSPRRSDSSSPSHIVKNPSLSNSAGKKEPSEHNQLNLAKIEEGLDTRTTIMIKNIPNKMTDRDLMAYIAKVCPKKIDFLYLRMDFKNGCNVGYAFVNFITVSDLLKFAKMRLGQKWNMFSSEKVLQMSYANYQGKEALVEKFKNSCIMDEREAWQPKIFFSEPGPHQGLPEPFPAPTHQRRKERSSHNRGALYVPGNTSLQAQNLLNAPFNPRRHESAEPRSRNNHRRQRTTTSGE
ncbi:hypothetical protein GYMLUDRAFT_37419 [Collybiopsis luxurians FD-317 M1]|nr:hypothetical protein GYMLUDRAFT_37419 [Collybiopsis luxurians FD-317 M1]